MSPGLGFTLVLLPLTICCLGMMGLGFDYYAKARNKKLIHLRGLNKLFFFKDNQHFPDKKNQVSRFSCIVQIINYIYIIVTLTVEILYDFIFHGSKIDVIGILVMFGYSILGALVGCIFSTIAYVETEKIKNKKELENQSFDDIIINKTEN